MSSETKLDFINERPVKNKYCVMTTVHMLELCKRSHEKTFTRLNEHLKGLTDKYYNEEGAELPPDIRAEITDLNIKISECEQIINDIVSAVSVISDTCNS